MSEESPSFTARFGQRLRGLRVACGLSQEGLAHAAGLHRTHVSLIERDRRSVRIETIERLASALGIEPAKLIPPAMGSIIETTGSHDPATTGGDLARFNQLFHSVRQYQDLADRHGIRDIFQDNGGKILQTLLILNLTCTGRREGNDAKDSDGNEYELKTVNIALTRMFSTHHHLNPTILAKYRSVKAWYFSLYNSIELVEIYRIEPDQLEAGFFAKWERQWHERGEKDLNNPKIPVKFVKVNGRLIYRDSADGQI